MSNSCIDKEDKNRINMILCDIKDNMNAIEMEIQKDNSYKTYLNEKLSNVITDVHCLNSIFKEDEEE